MNECQDALNPFMESREGSVYKSTLRKMSLKGPKQPPSRDGSVHKSTLYEALYMKHKS